MNSILPHANPNATEPDVILVGAGIMSATLGVILKEVEPPLTVAMFETLHDCAQESSNGWNNAGTGHAGNCELYYTPQRSDCSVDISKALEFNTEFDLSRQLWSFLVDKGAIRDPRAFIHPCPHMSFVRGAGNVAFLRQRFKEMSLHHCFHGMEYSEDRSKFAEWAPLIMDGRDDSEPFAATRIITGSEVDYGALTHLLIKHLSDQPGFDVHYSRKVVGLDREDDGRWRVSVKDVLDGSVTTVSAKFVFIGAGGGAPAVVAEVEDPRRQRLWRIPRQWHLAALRCRRGKPSPPCQGLWQGVRRFSAVDGAAPRHAHHRRQTLAAVRPLCGLLDPFPQAWCTWGPVHVADLR
jgi:malate dehydrogenase (quinone)